MTGKAHTVCTIATTPIAATLRSQPASQRRAVPAVIARRTRASSVSARRPGIEVGATTLLIRKHAAHRVAKLVEKVPRDAERSHPAHVNLAAGVGGNR